MTNDNETIEIATIGRCVGLHGALKLHPQTDFLQQFRPGNSFRTSKGVKLTVKSYDHARGLIRFLGYESKEAAQTLVNQKLLSTYAKTREECPLEEGQYYWFDVIGAEVYEGEELLGKVEEIERIAATDYLIVQTDSRWVEEGRAKRFYLPYITQYVLSFDPKSKRFATEGAKLLLESL